jgi:transposase-like protein
VALRRHLSNLPIWLETTEKEPREPHGARSATRQGQHRLTQAEANELAARYNDGSTICELAGLYGIHRTTVMALLERYDVSRRPSGRKLTDADVAEAARLYASGLSLAKVAARFGVHARTVREELVKAGQRSGPEGPPSATDP